MCDSALPSDLHTLTRLAPDADLNVGLFVSSVDGVVAIDGRVGGLTGPADQALLYRLREQSAAVVVGAATVRAEGYGRLLPDDAQRRRRDSGLAPEPELAIVSHSGQGLAGSEALASPTPTIVWTSAIPSTALDNPARGFEWLTFDALPDGRPDLAALSRLQHQRVGPGPLIWEGGPQLMRMAVEQGVIDELVIAISPQLAGAGTTLSAAGARASPVPAAGIPLALLGAAAADDFVFLRYRLLYQRR